MGLRSKVATLDPKVREQLEAVLIQTSFSGYEQLSAWLKDQGIDISKSALHRFGADFQRRVDALKLATEQARAIVKASPDDDNAANDALIRLLQEQLFTFFMALQENGERRKFTSKELSSLTKAVADLGRASVQQKKYMETVRTKAAAAAAAVEKKIARKGLSKETVAEIKAQILGIAK